MYLIPEEQYQLFHSLPITEAARLVPFDAAEVVIDTPLGYPALFVHGTRPLSSMRIWLQPRFSVNVPEYWRIEVVASIPFGPFKDETKRYVEVLPLDGLVGTKGIEVVGANGTKRIDVNLSESGSELP
jgi:hypothetical protein